MTKLEMAHEYALRMIINGSRWGDSNVDSQLKNISINAWKLADAMQAEAEKRGTVQHTRSGHTVTNYERPAVLQDECQPDWSAAPEWADCWSVNCMDGNAYWFSSVNDSYEKAPLFGYDGHWVGSFRKKPWGF